MFFSTIPKDFFYISSEQYKKHTVILDELSINYVKTGNGPSIILIHGLTNNWYGWGRLIPLLEKNFTVYALDLPGYGDSGDLHKMYTVHEQAVIVSRFIDSVVPDKPVLTGLSMGSVITAELGRINPDKLSGLVLIGPVFNTGKTSQLTKKLKQASLFFQKYSIFQSLLKFVVATRWFGYAANKILHMYTFKAYLSDLFGLEGRQKMRKRALIEMSISVAEYNLETVLQKVSLPLQLVFGKYDKVSQPDQVPAEIANKASIEVVDNAGHIVSVEKPEEVAHAITKFSQRLLG